MPGEGLNNQNQGTETNNVANEAFNAWEQMANDAKQGQQEGVEQTEFDANAYRAAVEDAEATMPKVETETVTDAWADLASGEGVSAGESTDENAEAEGATVETAEQVETKAAGREGLDAWLESVKGTPEGFWQRLAEEKREKGVELGEVPKITKVDRAIENFFENGIVGVTGKAREVREEMAKKAVLNDIAKLKERGGELNDEIMRNVFFGAQRMLEEMYRGNRELREDAQEEELSPDEEIAWHLKMDPRKARMNVLLAMQQHTRRPEETSDAYEARLRNYVEDTPAHRKQLESDQKYNTENPEDATEYAAQVLKNGQKDDLPEFTYLEWSEVSEAEQPVEREGRVKQLFERVRERVGFRKIVDKVMNKLAGAVLSATAWAEGVLAEEDEPGKAEVKEADQSERLRELILAKAEVERRMAQSQGDSAAMLKWADLVVKLNVKIAEVEAEGAAEALAA